MSANEETQNYSPASANRQGEPPIPVSSFIDSVVSLELATKKQIDTLLWDLPETIRSDTSEVAKHLRKKQLLTPLQAKNIADGKADLLKVGDDYILMEPLGKGGMGEVFKAIHKKFVDITETGVSLRGVRQLESLKPGIKVVFDYRLEFCVNSIKNGGKLKVEIPNQKTPLIIEREDELPVKFILRDLDFSNVEWPIVYTHDRPNVEIRRYSFANCKSIHGSSLYNLAMLTSLQELDLSGTSLVDEDLEKLSKAPWLQRVNLKGTPVTESGVKALAKQLPYLRIEWTGGVIQGKKRELDPNDKKKR